MVKKKRKIGKIDITQMIIKKKQKYINFNRSLSEEKSKRKRKEINISPKQMSKLGKIYCRKRKFHALKERINVNDVDIEYIIVSIKYPIEKNILGFSIGHVKHSSDNTKPLHTELPNKIDQ